MWFLSALVVLLLGAVAMVAAGHGAPLSQEHDDAPDVLLPDGELTATDLRGVRFPTAVRGYRMAEVDALLERLAREREADPAARRQSAAEVDEAKPDPTPVDGAGPES
ncbi:DivIVA domain-containing protein [Nocardioides acrostichi]|uniref:DivIVA domain-containing protein n=1 Tax=Nocardioides acrostichi TaxID=2784339 RepID=A0A930V1X2_9ACTN|nr:DivIVA domain-containing protein [Nocardioides acrostichi]MBF4162376.1 DivIVA domain-containing protein [Nocardioides acrostichi]